MKFCDEKIITIKSNNKVIEKVYNKGLDFINAGTRLEDFFRNWKLISYPPKISKKKFIPPCFYHFLFHTPLIFTISYFTHPFFQGPKIFSRKFENFLHHRIRHLEQNVFVFGPSAEKKPILLSTLPLI